jgi:ATP-dependent DNA ligase
MCVCVYIYICMTHIHIGELQSLCRVMSGFSDAFYKAARERLGAKMIAAPPSYYVTRESPSVWFDPQEVRFTRNSSERLVLILLSFHPQELPHACPHSTSV